MLLAAAARISVGAGPAELRWLDGHGHVEVHVRSEDGGRLRAALPEKLRELALPPGHRVDLADER